MGNGDKDIMTKPSSCKTGQTFQTLVAYGISHNNTGGIRKIWGDETSLGF